MRVLHCIGSMDRGGAETWLMRVLQQVDRERYQLDFCCLSGRPGAYSDEIEVLGGNVHPCGLSRNLPVFDRQFSQILIKGKYDIVHSHVHFFSGYLLRQAYHAGIQGRIAHGHSTTDGRSPTLARRFYRAWMRQWIRRYANGGVAASTEAGVELFGVEEPPSPKWQIIYCGIDLEAFLDTRSPAKTRADLGIAPDSLVVGHIGSFHQPKNHVFIVDLAQELIRCHPLACLLLVGDGPLRPGIEDRVRSLGLHQKVIFTGLRRDVPALLAAMDIFVMPSLFEGLPVAGLEAQAAGVPTFFADTITREAGVIPELVTYLPLTLSPQEWAHQVLARKQHRVDAVLRRAAFEQRGFTIQASTAQLSSLYESLVGRNHD
jgi:glycosyltransferase involved in cell wall biosynthesis